MDSSNIEYRRLSRRLFSVLRAIVRRSSDTSCSKSEFAARLEGRISALGRAQEMIMRSPREGIDFEELVHGELLAQAIPASRCRVSGPDTRISGEAALPLALALHELAVNLVIHGAVSGTEGSLQVVWEHIHRDARDWLRVLWQDSGLGPAGEQRAESGFGLELFERGLPYELDAVSRIDWTPQGVSFVLEIPAGQKTSYWHPGEQAPT